MRAGVRYSRQPPPMAWREKGLNNIPRKLRHSSILDPQILNSILSSKVLIKDQVLKFKVQRSVIIYSPEAARRRARPQLRPSATLFNYPTVRSYSNLEHAHLQIYNQEVFIHRTTTFLFDSFIE